MTYKGWYAIKQIAPNKFVNREHLVWILSFASRLIAQIRIKNSLLYLNRLVWFTFFLFSAASTSYGLSNTKIKFIFKGFIVLTVIFTFALVPLGRVLTPLSPPAIGYIVHLLFFNKDDLDIRYQNWIHFWRFYYNNCHVCFCTCIIGKGMNPLIPTCCLLDRTSAILQQVWLWY